MSPSPPSPINPSQTVERIREIIVGRHLERIEQRVARLEGASPTPQGIPSPWEDRLCTSEAKLEALHESVQRLGETVREETQYRSERYQSEIHRLASQIQQVAATRASESNPAAIQQLEARLGTWLTNWQGALQNHLNEREERLAGQIREEVARLWENTESQLTRLQSRTPDRDQIEERFRRIADAARALAESASPAPTTAEYATL